MSEVQLRYEELQTTLQGLRSRVDGLDANKSAAGREQELARLSQDVDRAKKDLRMVEMECRTLETSHRAQWKAKLKGEASNLKQILRDVEWARTTDQKAQGVGLSQMEPDKMGENDLVDYGKKLMKETDERADTTLNILTDTKETAAETAAKLKAQTEQLERVHDAAFEIEDTLQRATFIVKRMLRRTATDKYIWCLTFLIVCAIIAIIVLKIVKQETPNTQDTILDR